MVLQQWFDEVWNGRNIAAIDTLMSPHVVVHNLLAGGGEKTYDRQSFKNLFAPAMALLSDVHVAVETSMRDGDLRAARCVITAIHHNEKGEERDRAIRFTGMAMVRVREGRIEESWDYFDFETMYQQME